jgi:two-component system response regulator AtoC
MEFEILIIDDKLADAESVAEIISELADVKPMTLTSPDKAIQLIERNSKRFALILIDFNLNIKSMDGLILAKKIWEINSQQLIAIFSGEESNDVPIRCIGTPIVEFIKKGGPATLTQKKIQNLLKKYAATYKTCDVKKTLSENQVVCEEVGLVAKSTSMFKVANLMKKIAANSSATVLIRGDSGTGKEIVAKGIHNLSPRRDKPFIPINMGAFQSTLIESELFGHEKGSFTGANQTRKGSFELADGGTIFLDEIGELPIDLQVKLLRVLQEREVQPVGAVKTVKIDVRVIAATHVNLEAQIEAGKFRFDLFQRLNVIPVNLPGLSDRTDDIGLLAKHFLKKYSSSKSIHMSTLVQLEKYQWPGNVRELENLIQKLEILTDDQEILPQHLPSEIFMAEKKNDQIESFDFTMNYKSMVKFIEKLEVEYYIYHLAKAKSIRDAAVNRMDMAPTTLRDKMKAFAISFKENDSEIYKQKFEGNENEKSV